MFVYEKRLQYPIRIKNTNPRLAKMIITQYGGPHGEIGASLRYLSQRYAMPYPELKSHSHRRGHGGAVSPGDGGDHRLPADQGHDAGGD